MDIVRFNRNDRSTFPYWFSHWCAFNMTSLNLKIWKWKYLLHDIEKPWLRLFMDYSKVQRWHNIHRDHHLLCFFLTGKADWEQMVIDWECGRFTKQQCPRDSVDEYKRIFNEFEAYFTEGIISDNKSIKYFEENSVDHNLMRERCKIAYMKLKSTLERIFEIDLSDYYKINYLNIDE